MESGAEVPSLMVVVVLPILNLVAWTVVLGLLLVVGRLVKRWSRRLRPGGPE
jgi:uncharacterized membrane protein YecN with MAPEG domain